MPWTQPLPSHVPQAIRDRLGGSAARSSSVGRSGASVFRLPDADCGDCYLKAMFVNGGGGGGDSLRGERDRLACLHGRCGVDEPFARLPRVIAFAEVGDWTYLVTSTVAGQPGHVAVTETPLRVARLMGQALRRLHDLPPGDFSLRTGVADLLGVAAARVHNRRTRPSQLQSLAAARETPEKRLKRLTKRPIPDDPSAHVLTHGDYCLPNVLLDLGDTTGLIDVGGLMLADRHRDLAAAVRSLRYNGGQRDAVDTFLRWYGRELVDQKRLDYWADLLELV